MYELAYFMKQTEAELRANIRMLQQKERTNKKNKAGESHDFSKWIEQNAVVEDNDGSARPKTD